MFILHLTTPIYYCYYYYIRTAAHASCRVLSEISMKSQWISTNASYRWHGPTKVWWNLIKPMERPTEQSHKLVNNHFLTVRGEGLGDVAVRAVGDNVWYFSPCRLVHDDFKTYHPNLLGLRRSCIRLTTIIVTDIFMIGKQTPCNAAPHTLKSNSMWPLCDLQSWQEQKIWGKPL